MSFLPSEWQSLTFILVVCHPFFLDKGLFAAALNVESGEQTFLFVKQAKVDCFFDFCLKKVSSQ